MTAMRPVLDALLDANIVFLVAFGLWSLTQAVMARSRRKADYQLQLRLLRTVLLLVILSPVLSVFTAVLSQRLWPETPMTVSDLAVAAYLRGEIAMPAWQFEELLNSRKRWFDSLLAGDMPWLTAVVITIALGALALMMQTAIAIQRLNRIVTDSYVWRRTRTTDVRLSDTVHVPFATRGLWRRHVVLPSHVLVRPRELRIVLAHEFEHLRQGDVEWELAFEFLRPLLFWNPVFLLWRRAFGRLRELCCDRAALEALRISPREYAHCLLSFCGRAPAMASSERFERRALAAQNTADAPSLGNACPGFARHRPRPAEPGALPDDGWPLGAFDCDDRSFGAPAQ